MKAFLINLAVLFVIKVIDNMLGTTKTLLVQKNRAFLASITVIISQIIFYKLIDAIGDSGSDITMYVVSFASGVGTFLALLISNKFSRERVFVNIIMNDDKKVMKEFRDWLRDNKITNLTTDGYTKDWKKTLAITAYAETKEQSRMIDNYIKESNAKFKRIIQVQ